MRNGPGFDKFGQFPITGEDMRIYRGACSYQKSKVKK